MSLGCTVILVRHMMVNGVGIVEWGCGLPARVREWRVVVIVPLDHMATDLTLEWPRIVKGV